MGFGSWKYTRPTEYYGLERLPRHRQFKPNGGLEQRVLQNRYNMQYGFLIRG